MKIRLTVGIVFVLLGILIAVGPFTLFPVCGIRDTGDSAGPDIQAGNSEMAAMGGEPSAPSALMVMKCHWTAQASLGIGVLIAVLGILLIVFAPKQIRFGLSIALSLNGILAFLIPNVLIGVCGGVHMDCRALALPALSVISGIVVVAAIVNAVYLWKTGHEENLNAGKDALG